LSRQVHFIKQPTQLSSIDSADVSRTQPAEPDWSKLQPYQLTHWVPDMVHQPTHDAVSADVQRELDLRSVN